MSKASFIQRFVASLSIIGCTVTLAAQSKDTIQITDLGPKTSGKNIVLNEDLNHAAIVGSVGSRMAAFLDGKPGALYDSIPDVTPVLSADGHHYAYTALRGTDKLIVVDGKEYGPYDSVPHGAYYTGPKVNPYPGSVDLADYNTTPRQNLLFSPDGEHFAFIARKAGQTIVVEDGKQIGEFNSSSGISGDLVDSLLFSKQGDHLVFVLHDQRKQTSTVYLDGVAGPTFYAIKSPWFSEDGHHLLYDAEPALGKHAIVKDGVPGQSFDFIDDSEMDHIATSPDASHLVYNAGDKQSIFAVIDGHANVDGRGFWMSPEGSHVAYIRYPGFQRGRGGVGQMLVMDGKPGLLYTKIGDLRFAPDGHAVYSAMSSARKWFLINGAAESDPYNWVDLKTLVFSKNGLHMAYVAATDSGAHVVLDGRILKGFSGIKKPPYFLPDNSVVYSAIVDASGVVDMFRNDTLLGGSGLVSADGRRVATVKLTGQGTSEAQAQLSIDGKTGPVFQSIIAMAFSPDSRHFAYVGVRPRIKSEASVLIVDGAQVAVSDDVSRLEYSPDSRHLMMTSLVPPNREHGAIWMDGARIADYAWLSGSIFDWTNSAHAMTLIAPNADNHMTMIRYGVSNQSGARTAEAKFGTADTAETHRMLGSGAGIQAASAQVAGGIVPTSGMHGADGTVLPSGASAGIPAHGAFPAGTNVEVQLTETIDSNHGSGGQYRAQLSKPIVDDGGHVLAAAGAGATVGLVRNSGGWQVRLVLINVRGQAEAVTASEARLGTMAQSGTAESARQALSSLGNRVPFRIGHVHLGVPDQPSLTASRIVLPQGTHLLFSIGTP
jgi:hypothetical protein